MGGRICYMYIGMRCICSLCGANGKTVSGKARYLVSVGRQVNDNCYNNLIIYGTLIVVVKSTADSAVLLLVQLYISEMTVYTT